MGRWELVDGLQRVSTVLEFMGELQDESGKHFEPFTCDGTSLVPSLKGVRWPKKEEQEKLSEIDDPEILSLSLQLSIRRARIRVEILGQETDAHAKYELFQRLNSGGATLSEQELRNCIVVSISKPSFDNIKFMGQDANFLQLARVGDERIKRQYLIELVTRFIVLRNYAYQNGLDVHEYLDKGIITIAENKNFDWNHEKNIFQKTMKILRESVGEDAFSKSNRFSLSLYEFIALGLSKAIERSADQLDLDFVRERISEVPKLSAAEKYSGSGVRGTQRLASFVMPLAEEFFNPKS